MKTNMILVGLLVMAAGSGRAQGVTVGFDEWGHIDIVGSLLYPYDWHYEGAMVPDPAIGGALSLQFILPPELHFNTSGNVGIYEESYLGQIYVPTLSDGVRFEDDGRSFRYYSDPELLESIDGPSVGDSGYWSNHFAPWNGWQWNAQNIQENSSIPGHPWEYVFSAGYADMPGYSDMDLFEYRIIGDSDIPEPSGCALFGLGVLRLVAFRVSRNSGWRRWLC